MYIRKRKQRCTSRCCLAEAGERKNRNQDSPPKEVGVFSFHRKLRPMKQKTLRGMRTRAKKKHVASDRARRENVPRHILFYGFCSRHLFTYGVQITGIPL